MTDEELLGLPLSGLTPELMVLAAEANDRRIAAIRKENDEYVLTRPASGPFIVSDDLGSRGVLNPADGKKYDSKSAYYRAVKAKGNEIVGNEKLGASKPNAPEIDWKRAVAETLQQKGL
jgi:hypothetical protein